MGMRMTVAVIMGVLTTRVAVSRMIMMGVTRLSAAIARRRPVRVPVACRRCHDRTPRPARSAGWRSLKGRLQYSASNATFQYCI